MLECIERVERFVGQDHTRFMQSDLVQDAVVRNLQSLAESSQKLSEKVKNTQTGVDWRAIAGFRNVLVHDYLGLDLENDLAGNKIGVCPRFTALLPQPRHFPAIVPTRAAHSTRNGLAIQYPAGTQDGSRKAFHSDFEG